MASGPNVGASFTASIKKPTYELLSTPPSSITTYLNLPASPTKFVDGLNTRSVNWLIVRISFNAIALPVDPLRTSPWPGVPVTLTLIRASSGSIGRVIFSDTLAASSRIWIDFGESIIGALLSPTSTLTICDTLCPKPSSALISTAYRPVTPSGGEPINLPVIGSKLIHSRNSRSPSIDALSLRLCAPESASANASPGTTTSKSESSLTCNGAASIVLEIVGAVLPSSVERLSS